MKLERSYGFGQVLESAIPVPGAIASSTDHGSVGITIITDSEVRHNADLFSYANEQLLYAPVGVGSFRCSADRIAFAAEDGVEPSLMSELLVANALPAAIWQQGGFMLHASGVQLPGCDRAIAIAGDTGSGKSTIARSLLDIGASLIGDDSLRIDRVDAGYRLAGLPGGLFKWSADGSERRFETVSNGLAEGAMGAIVVLGPRIAQGFELIRCDRMQSVELLLAHRHRAVIADLLGRRQSMLDWLIETAGAVPLFLWHRAVGNMDVSEAEIAALRQALDQ